MEYGMDVVPVSTNLKAMNEWGLGIAIKTRHNSKWQPAGKLKKNFCEISYFDKE